MKAGRLTGNGWAMAPPGAGDVVIAPQSCGVGASVWTLDQLVAALEDPADVLPIPYRVDVGQRIGGQGDQFGDFPRLQRPDVLVDLERLRRGFGGGDDRLHRREAGLHEQAE